MLIRIVPEMFISTQFQCQTIQEVRKEIFQTTKLAHKYPWRNQYKDKIRCLPNNFSADKVLRNYYEAITSLIQSGTINERKSCLFDLSYVDIVFLSHALARGFRITTGDENLFDFALQEFGDEFKGNVSPLGMINGWIKDEIIKWDDPKHTILSDWKLNNEHPQPDRQIRKFKKLTNRNYPGN
jgi:hypothetical protein